MEGTPVDDAGREPAARWLAWVTAALLAAAGISAGVVQSRGERSGGGVVATAGRAGSTLAVPATTSPTPPPSAPVTSAPPSTVARTTTVPKAAAAVLAALGSTVPPTTHPPAATTTTATTRPPATTTTTRPATTTTSTSSTTTTTVPGKATVSLANDHPNPFVLTINGQEFTLASGDRVDNVEIVPDPKGNDSVSVRASTDPTCVANISGAFFQNGGRYLVTIVAGQAACTSFPAPELKISQPG